MEAVIKRDGNGVVNMLMSHDCADGMLAGGRLEWHSYRGLPPCSPIIVQGLGTCDRCRLAQVAR